MKILVCGEKYNCNEKHNIFLKYHKYKTMFKDVVFYFRDILYAMLFFCRAYSLSPFFFWLSAVFFLTVFWPHIIEAGMRNEQKIAQYVFSGGPAARAAETVKPAVCESKELFRTVKPLKNKNEISGSVNKKNKYLWLKDYDFSNSIAGRILPPEGYFRQPAGQESFANWLRGLPLKKGRPPVYLYNKKLKANQKAHYAVIDIDCGARDLQQCADAVMRLRAEYLLSKGDIDSIGFNTGDSKFISFTGWLAGQKKINGRVKSYENFKKYMNYIFAYAGTYSLAKSLNKVFLISDIKAGDVFIKGGFPGHAVMVADVVINKSGHKKFLLIQSYMPAQDIHVLINPANEFCPWYDSEFGEILITPEWEFTPRQLMRF